MDGLVFHSNTKEYNDSDWIITSKIATHAGGCLMLSTVTNKCSKSFSGGRK